MNFARTALASLTASVVLATGLAPAAHAGPAEDRRLQSVEKVLAETQAMPDQQMPDWLLQRAQGIAILPQVVKAAIGLGGRGGNGVLLVRTANGGWSNPAFIRLLGGSVGWQLGVQASDIVLVFTTRKSVEGITGGKLTLGGDASVAVGPVGRQVSGATDVTLNAEVYSYSRAQGLFGGVAIDGTVIAIDHKANERYYGRDGVLASDIFAGSVPAPASAQTLKTAIDKLARGVALAPPAATPVAAPASAAAAPAAAATAPSSPAPAERGLESGGAATFPLDDAPKKPAGEPVPH